jgi:DNA gyrase subunit B
MQKYGQMTTSQIQQLSPIEHIRRRPGMYIGGKDKRALHQLIEESILFSVQDAVLGMCYHLSVQLLPSEIIVICADGASLPVDKPHPYGCLSTFEAFMIHPLRSDFGVTRFDLRPFGSLGLGYFVVNYLSSFFRVEIRRGNSLWRQEYQYGLPKSDVEMIHSRSMEDMPGMTLMFAPDFGIFEAKTFDYTYLVERCQELAYLIPGFTISLADERAKPPHASELVAKRGLADWILALNAGKSTLHEVVHVRQEIDHLHRSGEQVKIRIACAFQYTAGTDTLELSYGNLHKTPEGGTHVQGLRDGIQQAVKGYLNQPVQWKALAAGFTGILSVIHPDLSYEGAISYKVLNPELQAYVAGLVQDALKQRPDVLAAMARKFT